MSKLKDGLYGKDCYSTAIFFMYAMLFGVTGSWIVEIFTDRLTAIKCIPWLALIYCLLVLVFDRRTKSCK